MWQISTHALTPFSSGDESNGDFYGRQESYGTQASYGTQNSSGNGDEFQNPEPLYDFAAYDPSGAEAANEFDDSWTSSEDGAATYAACPWSQRLVAVIKKAHRIRVWVRQGSQSGFRVLA